jgi:glycine cleavage system H protein
MSPTSDLELTIDKFTFRVPQDRLYSREDCWVQITGEQARIGITDFRQQASGDVALVETSPVGMMIAQNDEFATIETMKINLAIPCPISGAISAVNTSLAERPELLNQDPYGEGWLVEMVLRRPEQAQSLLSPAQYFAIMRGKAESERSKG